MPVAPSCAAIAAAYAADREALQSLRQDAPEPPRDLWARTAAAIEQLSQDGGAPVETIVDEPAPARRGRLGSLPLGAMSAVAVVVIVVGASLLSRGITSQTLNPSPAASVGTAEATHHPSPALPGAEATPFPVGAGDVQVVDNGPGGVGYSTYQVEQVCPEEGSSNCSAIPNKTATALGLTEHPAHGDRVPVAPAGGRDLEDSRCGRPGRDRPTARHRARGVPSPTPARTEPPTPPPSADASSAPVDSAEPTDGATPTVVIQSAPPSATPLATPSATATNLAIASGIEVVGESAAYSADGGWFAFTARPGDGSGGPDVYIWRVGDARAERLTTDQSSYFASWSGNRAIVSRPADREARRTDPVSVAIDPASRDERSVGAVWRPMVDPSGRFAIAWDGTLERTDGPLGWRPAEGRLALRTWSDGRDGGTPNGSEDRRVVADEAQGDFDVRWDETGEWAAIWVGNDSETATGRLTLVHLDKSKDRFEHIKGAPEDLPAMPGFSIASGRLAWATPRGQGGEGSRVQIAAWSGNGVGIVASGPGEDVVVIR